MTAKEVIEETIKYYSTHPRGILGKDEAQACVYLNEDNKAMCAVGRCLTTEALDIAKDIQAGVKELLTRLVRAKAITYRDGAFKPGYRGFTEEFWGTLQKLHDQSQNWYITDQGAELTVRGEEMRDFMLKNAEEGKYTA